MKKVKRKTKKYYLILLDSEKKSATVRVKDLRHLEDTIKTNDITDELLRLYGKEK